MTDYNTSRARVYKADKHTLKVLRREIGMKEKDLLRDILHDNKRFKRRYKQLRMELREQAERTQ